MQVNIRKIFNPRLISDSIMSTRQPRQACLFTSSSSKVLGNVETKPPAPSVIEDDKHDLKHFQPHHDDDDPRRRNNKRQWKSRDHSIASTNDATIGIIINNNNNNNNITPHKKTPTSNKMADEKLQFLSRKLQVMMDIECHHIISISDHDDDDMDLFHTWIDWCPKYEAVPGTRGGKSILHHTCRKCRRVSFHLLDKIDGAKQRICLQCWDLCPDRKLVPEWYYHNPRHCPICRGDDKKRGSPAPKRTTTTTK